MSRSAYALGAALLSIVLAATASLAVAGVTVTEKPGLTVMKRPDGTAKNLYQKDAQPGETTHAACLRLLKESGILGEATCSDVAGITVAKNCEGEPAPRIYLSLVDLPDGNGTKGWELPPMEPPTLQAGSDTDYMPERDWLYVHGPKWPDGYPNCWVRGWEDPTLWRQNPKADPGKLFMERIEPGMTSEDVELPNDESYTCWPTDTECVPPVPPT